MYNLYRTAKTDMTGLGMVVYIDVLIVINTYITYFILRAASRMLHTSVSFRRIAAASVIGGVSSLAALAVTDVPLSLLLKAALTVVTVITAFGFGSFRALAVRSFFCITAGMLICGAAVMIHELADTDFIFSANGYLYMDISALVLVVSSAAIYAVLCIVRRITDSPSADERVVLTVEKNGTRAVLSALPDSGNYLRDFLTGRPVIICRASALGDVLPKNAERFLEGDADDVSGIRLIPMKTAGGSSLAAAFRPDRITADGEGCKKNIDALIAVAPGALEGESFDAVINSRLLK